MKSSWQNMLETLSRTDLSTVLKGIRRGIERESLRVDAAARLARTAHPVALGAALTHPRITTDFAESLMEFITPAGTEAEATLALLADIHRHVYRHIGNEWLWPVSMPCRVETEDDIALAQYGHSNAGKMKTVYRRGLKNRYGSLMQIIAGVHYNFSMPDSFWPVWQRITGDRRPLQDFISESYLGLTRNFLRLGWLVPYLFGASPAVSSSFLKKAHGQLPLEKLGQDTCYLPMATSLRLSEMGYNTKAQDDLAVSYDSLGEFVAGMRQAAGQPNAAFETIGVRQQGEYRQLNTNTLQSESELYAPIRLKRVTKPGERISDALEARGVEYVEIRSLDVNPYAAAGIDLDQVLFLDLFLTYCLLKDSPRLSRQQQHSSRQNLNKVAIGGRDVSLQLTDDGQPKSLKAWAEEIFAELIQLARLLDHGQRTKSFQAAVDCQYQKLAHPGLTPSARVLKEMKEKNLEIGDLAMSLAQDHRRTLLGHGYVRMSASEFDAMASVSWQKQKKLEETDKLSFDDFLRQTSNSPLSSPPPKQRTSKNRCSWPSLLKQPLKSCTV